MVLNGQTFLLCNSPPKFETTLNYKPILLFFGLLLNAFFTKAQDEFYFRHYQVENGLSNNTVMCSVQDDKGFMWLGTKDGLNRFDGNAFKVFRQDEENKNSIGNDYIRCLYLDKKGRMFVGTQRGLYQYHPVTESFTHVISSGTKSIEEVCVDKQGNIWYIAEGSLICQEQFRSHVYDPALFFTPTALCITPEGSLWVSSSQGQLHKYNTSSDSFTSYPVLSPQSAVTCWIEKMVASSSNTILVGTSALGLYSFDIDNAKVTSIISRNSDNTGIYVRDILQVNQAEIWLATESGIFVYNQTKQTIINLKKNYHNPYSLSDNAVYTLCKDRENGLWAGTYFGGINYYVQNQLQFQKYFPDYSKNTINGNAVREIVKDKYNNLWVGTEDAGLNKIDAKGKITHFMPTGSSSDLSYYNIHGLLAVENELWVGTFEHGLDVLDILTGKVIRHYAAGNKPGDLRSNFIFSLYRTRAGTILAGTTAGVYQYDKANDVFIPIPQLSGYTYNILEDHAGVLWSATISEGVKFFNPATNKAGNFTYQKENKNSISNNMVNALYEDEQHNIWIATEGGGACRLGADRKTIQRFNTRTGLPGNFVFKVLQDDLKQLWLTTSKGLVQLNPITYAIKVYTSANGLLNDQFNYNSGFKDLDGRLFFGSVKGMISFKPQSFKENYFNPPVYFTGFQVNNEEVPIQAYGTLPQSILYTKAIELSHKQSSFSIDFAALTHTAPQMNTYAYTMQGVDTGWVYLEKNRKVYFTDLSPGKYIFKVKTANSSGTWNKNQATLSIIIHPPWWLSYTAYILYILFTSIAAILLFWYYHKHLQRENQQRIELLLFEKEKEIYDAKMKFFTNIAHEIRTPLTLIKGPLERVIDKTAGMPEIKNSLAVLERNTNRLLHLTDQLLDYRKTEAGGFVLTFEEENISKLLEEIFTGFTPLAEQKNIQYLLHLPQKSLITYADNEVLNKILSNLVSNAIKYANKEVRISLTAHPKTNSFMIEIDNDGYIIPQEMREKVFEPFVRLKGTEKQQGTGIGLALARSLTELHQGTLAIEPGNKNFNRFVLQLPMLQTRPTIINNDLAGENIIAAPTA
jgi:signal transduction histidine kinase/ligand-binding sensor domain-containing protein